MKLTNNFHNTEYTTRKTRNCLNMLEEKACTHPEDLTNSEKAFIRRVRKSLCGMEDCLCGNFWGER